MHQLCSSRCNEISNSNNGINKSFSFRSSNNLQLQLQLPLVVKHQQLVMEVFIQTTFHHHHHHHLWRAPSYLMHFLHSLEILLKAAVAAVNQACIATGSANLH
jgi:hypothetical protein